MKKILSILLSLVMLLGVLPLTVSAADVDTAETGSSDLRINSQPPEELVITADSDDDTDPIYPFMTFSVSGGTGNYTYKWYFDGDSENYTFNLVATTTVPVYKVDRAGYWHCTVGDGESVLATNRTKVIRSKKSPATRVRMNGTKLQWLANRAEEKYTDNLYGHYMIHIYRLDLTHADETDAYFLEIKRNSDGTLDMKGRDSQGHISSEVVSELFEPTYTASKHMYTIDIKKAVERDKNYDDIKYEFAVYSPGYSSKVSYIGFKPVKQLYNGEIYEYSDQSSGVHTGEIFASVPEDQDGNYLEGSNVTANLNGGRWGNAPSLKYSIVSQIEVDSEWQEYQQGKSFTFTEDLYGEVLLFKLKPTLLAGRIAGEYFWDDEYFVGGIAFGKKNVKVSGTINCTITEPQAGAAADCSITATDSNNWQYYHLAEENTSGTGLEWRYGNVLWNNDSFEDGETYTAFVILEMDKSDKYLYNYDEMTVYFNGKQATTTQVGNYLHCKMDYTVGAGSGFTVSGSYDSFLDGYDAITIELMQDNTMKYATASSGNAGTYSISGVASGDYTLRVSKKNHVTRDYAVTVSGNTTQDVKICPIGDADNNGKVNAADAKAAFQHGNEQKLITDDYKFKCADVASPKNRVNSADAKAIFRHANEQQSLWTE